MKLTAVLCARNDNYGGMLVERATLALNSMLDTFDEVIYVDWNSEGKNLIEEMGDRINDTGKLKFIIVTPEQAKEFTNNDPDAQKVVEVMARNIGIRRATGDIIVSTNIDVVVPRREILERFFRDIYNDKWAYTFSRRNVMMPYEKITKENCHSIREQLERDMFKMNPKGVEPGFSRVLGCGDFQLAKKEHWYKVKGFEENMIYRMVADSQVQMKMIKNGIFVAGLFDYPIFHLDHPDNNSGGGGELSGKINRNFRKATVVEETKNTDNWGFPNIEFTEGVK